MGDFDSVKIGVCDAYWTPPGGAEIFLGLTKGGCELSYTPEWYDLQVDRYGKSPTDAALVGEAIAVKVPLAETDLDKINMFAHTATKVDGNLGDYKLTFGRFPGFRLGNLAGRLRLHPLSMGQSKAEDVIIYKAVNKAPLQLNYKLDEERIFQTEFQGMIKRSHISGALLWEIGDSTIGESEITLSSTLDANGLPDNLMAIIAKSGGYMWINVPETPVYTSTDDALRTANLKAYVEFNGNVYNVTSLANFSLDPDNEGAWMNGQSLCKANGGRLPNSAPNLMLDFIKAGDLGSIVVNGSTKSFRCLNLADLSFVNPYKLKVRGSNVAVASNWGTIELADVIEVQVKATAGTIVSYATLKMQVTN